MPTQPVASDEFKICAGCSTQVGCVAQRCPHCHSEAFWPVLMEPPWSKRTAGRKAYWIFIYVAACLFFAGAIALVFRFVWMFVR